MSGEFEPTRAIWLSFDPGHSELTSGLVKALVAHVEIKLVTKDAESSEAARELLMSKGIQLANVQFLIEPKCLFFMRDIAVFARSPNGQLNTLSFRWQSYGLAGWCRRRYLNEIESEKNCIGAPISNHNEFGVALSRLAKAANIQSNLVLEGGAVEVNGQGLIIANETLTLQRNPGKTRALLEREYLNLPSIRKVIWLPEGLAEDPHLRATITGNYVGWGTGGHTDEFVRFADAKTVMLAWPSDAAVAQHPVARLNRIRMQRCFDILSRVTDIEGNAIRVVKVPLPKIIERPVFLAATTEHAWSHKWTAEYFPKSERRREGDRVIQVASASYMNFVIANGVVVVPSYIDHGTSAETEAKVLQIFRAVFQNRQIRFVDAITANWFGGGPHCATLREPAV